MKKPTFFLVLAAISFLLLSCSNDDFIRGFSRPGYSSTDTAAWYGITSVNLKVKAIQYVTQDSVLKDANFTANTFTETLNSNGDSVLLSKIHLPDGRYVRQVQLILETGSSVALNNGSNKSLSLPSNSDSIVTIAINQVIPSQGTYSVLLNNNIITSIYKNTSGNYILYPFLQGYGVNTTSSVFGYILPRTLATKVFVVNGTDTISTVSNVANNNYFQLSSLSAGKYTLQFMPVDSAKVTYSTVIHIKYGYDIDMGHVIVIK
jgi:hypothetical protein